MLFTEQTHEQTLYDSSALRLYTSGLSVAFLDIETTGLSAAHDYIILGGFSVAVPPQSVNVRQYFARSKKEEGELLSAYRRDLADYDIWITYNGNSFDLPFLKKRLAHCHLADPLPLHLSLDLYAILRRFSPLPHILPDLRQKTVEDFLGLNSYRRDQISGKDSTLLYRSYLENQKEELLSSILLHNFDDLCLLNSLMRVLEKLDLHKIMFHTGFMVSYESKRLLVEKLSLDKTGLNLTGKTKNTQGDYTCFSPLYQVLHQGKTGEFSLKLPCFFEQGAIFLDLMALSKIPELSFDFSPLMKYNGYASKYLILHNGKEPLYQEINHTLLLFLREILRKL